MMRREYEVFDTSLKALPLAEFKITYSHLHDGRKLVEIAEEEDKAYQTILNIVSKTRKKLEGKTIALVHRKVDDSGTNFHINTPKTEAGCRRIQMIGEVYDAFLEEYQIQQITGFCTQEIDGYSGFVFASSGGTITIPSGLLRTPLETYLLHQAL